MKKNIIREYLFKIEIFLHGDKDSFTPFEAQGIYNILEDFNNEIDEKYEKKS